MRRVAVALQPGLKERMLTELGRHGHEVVFTAASGADLAAGVATQVTDAALVSSAPGFLDESVRDACDFAGVRIVAIADGSAGQVLARDLGISEVAQETATWAEIEGLLEGEWDVPAPTGGPAREGRVIAVWGPAGAPGRTTMAINIAAELARHGHSVALADADTHSGSVAPALGLLDEAPGFAAACRLAGADALDRGELERVGQRYHSGHGAFWVLTGLGRPGRWPELSAARVERVLSVCRTWVDYTVVDTGASLENDEEISSDLAAPRRNAATIASLRGADTVIAVGSGDPVGLSRFLRAHVDLVGTVESERITVVITKVRASVIGMNPAAQITQTLSRFGGISSAVIVPHDLVAHDAAILAGETLVDAAPKSPARLAVQELVTKRILPPVASPPRRRILLRARARA